MYELSEKTGVAIIFFNRPTCLKKVFESVSKAKPSQLFLIQDGPRGEKDLAGIEACRAVVENIDWPCEVHRNYSEVNLGCGRRMSSGITWVFEHVDRAMILEDDCVPGESFYQYCDELLEKYKDDQRILMISGMNHWGQSDVPADYLFAYSGAIWGWATWKRSWEKFDYSAEAINDPEVVNFLMSGVEPKRVAISDIERWQATNAKVKSGEKMSYWAHQWRLAKFLYHNLCIIPKCNLISNVGDNDATHPASGGTCEYHYLQTYRMNFPMIHPKYVMQNHEYDDKYYEVFEPTRWHRIKMRIKGWLNHEERK